jgi:ribosomal peptide maturation radical SAM protein 1
VKRRGIPCKSFYWNQDFLNAIPHKKQESIYQYLSYQYSFPLNEWIFSTQVFLDDSIAPWQDIDKCTWQDIDKCICAASDAVDDNSRLDILSKFISKMKMVAETSVSQTRDRLASYALIGINTSYFQTTPALALAKKVKEIWPDKIIVFGGANCHGILGKTLIDQFNFIDFVFLGEADFTFPDLVHCLSMNLPFDHIDGIAYRDGNKVVVREAVSGPTNLDNTPMPDFDDYIEQYIKSNRGSYDTILLPLESSRGCWWGQKHHCTFCGLNEDNLTYRRKSWPRFREEIQTVFQKYGVRYFFMTDNMLSPSYVAELAAWNADRKISFFYEVRPSARREYVSALVDAGITMVQPGIEHFSTSILALMRKALKAIDNIAFLKYAREYGLHLAYNVLCRIPGEEPEEYHKLVRNLPKITHLEPPNGLSAVQYHRFSAYHSEPQRFSIRLKPYRGYQMLYPFEKSVIENLAYFFEITPPLVKPEVVSYIRDLNLVINQWRNQYLEDICTLSWHFEGDDIVVEDRRWGFPRRNYRIKDEARNLLFIFDKPKKLDAAISELASSAHRDSLRQIREAYPSEENPEQDFLAEIIYGGVVRSPSNANEDEEIIQFSFAKDKDPTSCVAEFADKGLIYQENDFYLSLPVYRGRRRTDRKWGLFHV